MDAIVARSITMAGVELSASAASEGTDKICERGHMQPAMLRAFSSEVGARVAQERKLPFADWKGIEGRSLGPIDLAVERRVGSGWSAFVELKWCPADGKFLAIIP